MKVRVKNFFPGANTAEGFYSFFTYLSFKTKRIYIIKGGPGTGKSTLMKDIAEKIVKMGMDIENHWCASDHKSLDGLVIPKLKSVILDGTAPHTVDPIYPGAVEEIINLGQFWNSGYLIKNSDHIIKISNDIKNHFKKTYHYLQLALICNNEIENIHQQVFNSDTANSKIQNIIKDLPDGKSLKQPSERHLFASGITPGGLVNFFDNITLNCNKRYLLKGKPGTGKSTLIKKIAATAINQGYNTLYLHCSLNPKNVDGAVIPELKTAVINNTSPHTVKQNKKNDKIINMMECLDKTKIPQEEIEDYKQLYEKYINKALEELKKEKTAHDKLEEYYIKAMNFRQVERKKNRLLQELLSYNIK